MFALRSGQFVHRALSQYTMKHCNQGQCLRSFSSTAHEIQKSRDDLPIQMENPYKEPTKGCILCNVEVDFKNVQLLSQFVSPHTGRIYGRHITGLCGRKQRQISKAIKRLSTWVLCL